MLRSQLYHHKWPPHPLSVFQGQYWTSSLPSCCGLTSQQPWSLRHCGDIVWWKGSLFACGLGLDWDCCVIWVQTLLSVNYWTCVVVSVSLHWCLSALMYDGDMYHVLPTACCIPASTYLWLLSSILFHSLVAYPFLVFYFFHFILSSKPLWANFPLIFFLPPFPSYFMYTMYLLLPVYSLCS